MTQAFGGFGQRGRGAVDIVLLGAAGEVDMAGLTSDTRAAWRELKGAAADAGYTLRERSARRLCDEQNQLYSIGRGDGDARAVVTGARGCMSWHVQGRAVDFDVYLPSGAKSSMRSDYAAVGQLAKSLGWGWGGDFTNIDDVGHVEWHPGMKIEDACPDPSHCVDVQATFDDEPLGMSTPMLALAIVVPLAVAGGVGAALATR